MFSASGSRAQALMQLGHCGPGLVDALGAEAAGQQVQRLALGEQVKRQRDGPVQGDQSAEPVAAGDDDQAAGRARQQRTHLLGRAGVVEQYQQAPAGQLGSVERCLAVRIGRNAAGRYPERVQHPPVRVGWGQRRVGRVEAAQVDVELPVGEMRSHLVPPVHRQRRFADSGGAADGGDHDQADCGRLGQQFGQRLELGLAAHEMIHRRGQLPRHGGGRDRRGPAGAAERAQQLGVAREDTPLQLE